MLIKSLLEVRLREKSLIQREVIEDKKFELTDGRVVTFAKEPDVAIHKDGTIKVALEIKGGIDTAAVLERAGAAVKSLSRAKKENPASVTILLLQGVSVTQQAIQDLRAHRREINHWFRIEDIVDPKNEAQREALFQLLGF